MKINKKLIKYNFSSRNGTKIKYIVIHDTGNKSKGSGANNHFIYFNGGNRQASAHYFVDDKEILQIIDDEKASWHVGDGKGKYGVTNSNSIGIEICVNSDGNYSIAVKKTIDLILHLMKIHNIPVENVIRHYDASRKNCPASMSANDWKDWFAFKTELKNKLNQSFVKVKINGKLYDMEGVFQNNKNYVGIRELAETLGYKVTWNQEEKVVEINE